MSKYSKAVGSIAGGHWGYSVGGGALGGAALGAGIGALAADDTGLGAMVGGGSGLAFGAGGGAFAKAAANNIMMGHGALGGVKGLSRGFTGKYTANAGQRRAALSQGGSVYNGYHSATSVRLATSANGTFSPV